uniref:Tegument protein UL23 n=1 Tax=Mastomys natalensis cytomegalovirus 2 TaxID=2973540 RepID=A0A9Y1IMJ2_9BETA|nr:tegument protein UL23 [Mastomys natalensis cytomegalovirus 2]WEG69163.1 tegument protein UL23 [Mastomys natalensis cytomegalovirus 2]WEG69302.1 tegument protein UL23 [Mastomys natalensis cytomegalovirus 2]WEG69440.1 tegument protein UL23 [Mastomys natalensis cytomegalovirus 2]WEG69578.1 tegument protein UL23 [Mastomys natalensis cytomegalovirus 2]
MAPPEVLREILTEFSAVDAGVSEHTGRRVRLAEPKGVILCVGRRWRDIPPPQDGGQRDEGARLADLMCCSEELKFVGSIVAGTFELPDKPGERRRGRVFSWMGSGGGTGGSGGSTDSDEAVRGDSESGVVGAALVAAAAVLGPAAVYAPNSDLPAYRQAPEVYVGSTGKVYVYLRVSRSEAIACVASTVSDFIKDGINNLYLPVRRPIPCRGTAARELTECRNCDDAVVWRERYLARYVVLGDKTEISPCDNLFVGVEPDLLDRWAAEADVDTVDVIALVSHPLAIPPLVVLTDDIGRVYVVQGASSLVIVADDFYEFVERGVSRYNCNHLFIGDPLEASLAKGTRCPNGFYHHVVSNGVPHGSEPMWTKKKKSRGGSIKRTMSRLFRSLHRK